MDTDRAECEKLLEELATENESLRSLLKISDSFSSPVVLQKIDEQIKLAEASNQEQAP